MKQLKNAQLSNRESREPGSKTTAERRSHRQKHFSQSTSIAAGIRIASSDKDVLNAHSGIRVIGQPSWKQRVCTVLEPAKTPDPKSVIRFGMTVCDCSPQNHRIEAH
jgi:hypothetical protein